MCLSPVLESERRKKAGCSAFVNTRFRKKSFFLRPGKYSCYAL